MILLQHLHLMIEKQDNVLWQHLYFDLAVMCDADVCGLIPTTRLREI